MKVYNQEKTQILTEYDLSKGKLLSDTIAIELQEIQGVEEQGHYETIAEYPNGGKDVKWVVDVAGVEYQPAGTKEESIYVYVPYTQEELEQQEMDELKQQLSDMDYKTSKYVDGDYTEEQWQEIVAERKAIRERIRKLEKNLNIQ